ncbi:MAG TPA: hypothetical protein VHO03_19105 [Ignavibacteriales bacterium]|nr:hypothetical protein [Ignavibacteriales bacterium]
MKMTNLLFILLFIVLFINRESFSQEVKPQETNGSLSALIGTASLAWPTLGGGGLSGINYSFSGGIQLSENVSFTIQADFTSFGVTDRAEGDIQVSYQPNPIFSFAGEIVPKLWGGLNVILGLGVSSQKGGAIPYHYYNSKENRSYTVETEEMTGAEGSKAHGIIGFGGDIKLSKALFMPLQARFFIANYGGWILETGLKYKF